MNEKTKAQRTLRTAQKMRQKKDDNVDGDDEDDDDDEEEEEEEEEVRQTSQTERLAALPIELNLNPNLKSKPKLNLGIKYLMNVLLVLGLCLSAQLVRSACCLFFEGSSCFCALSRHSFCSCLALSHYSPLALSLFLSLALTALLLKIAEKRERISQI